MDRHGHLTLYGETSIRKRNTHRSLIDRFEKPVPQLVVHLVERGDDRCSSLLVKHFQRPQEKKQQRGVVVSRCSIAYVGRAASCRGLPRPSAYSAVAVEVLHRDQTTVTNRRRLDADRRAPQSGG